MVEPFNFRDEKNKQLVEYAELHPGITYRELAQEFRLTEDKVRSALRRAKHIYKLDIKRETGGLKRPKAPTSKGKEYIPPPPNTENVGIIGDTHFPFVLDGYLEFCIETFKKHDVTHVIHIGDVIDSHAWSYHEPDPDGMSPNDELEMAKEIVAEWYAAFPKMDVIWGNHDRLVMRKAFSSHVPRQMIMDFQDLFGTPTWHWTDRVVYDGVQYIHGEGATARTRARKDLMPTVQGHRHPEAYTDYAVGQTYRIFGMQVGCGVDRKAYAFEYAKDHPKPAIGVGLVLNHGTLPLNVLMKL